MPVRRRTTERVPTGAEGTKVGDYEALKRAIRAARGQAGIESDTALALRSGVHLQTLQNWMYGKTTPRPSELHKVARLLDLRLDDLMAVYEGRDPEPKPLQDAIRELIDQLGEQTKAITELAEALRAGEGPEPPIVERAREAVAAFDAEAGRPRSTPQRRRSGRDRRDAGDTRRSREGEAS